MWFEDDLEGILMIYAKQRSMYPYLVKFKSQSNLP